MQLTYALRRGVQGFRHGYESRKAERLAIEAQANPPQPRLTFREYLKGLVFSTYAVVLLLITLAIVAIVSLGLVAIIKWAYVEVFNK